MAIDTNPLTPQGDENKPNTVGLGEYKDIDLIVELESRGYYVRFKVS